MKPDEKSTQKKSDWISIGIFVVICFVLAVAPAPYVFQEDGGNELLSYVLVYMISFSPMIACVVTRLVTKEGFHDGVFMPHFHGNAKVYVLAVLIPLLMGVAGAYVMGGILRTRVGFDPETSANMQLAGFLLQSVMIYPNLFFLLGEEVGWRAFLYDKLDRQLGVHGSLLVGGCIWGLWHAAPIYYEGINFGKDYPGYPYVGILLMCVMCCFFGALLQWLRKKSGSMLPALLAHAVVDTMIPYIMTSLLTPEVVNDNIFMFGAVGVLIPSVIGGIPCWILLARDSKKRQNRENPV